ncbi:MAG: TetR/AcrR family transcriptional regulator [Spirochaetaceae bacterium]|nr:MAG: TetR/AcrR family transcriptional regulator [Spirochaetaceae bacterium]
MEHEHTTRPRDRSATERRLVQATLDLIREGGFDAAGVNAIAERAGVSKVLIYRYFGDYQGLLRAVGDEIRLLETDLATGILDRLGVAASPGDVIRETIVSLREMVRRDELLRKVLIWELSSRNDLTDAFAQSRERIGTEQTAAFDRFLRLRRPDDPIDSYALLAIVSAGVFYLALRSDSVAVFNGVDLQSEEGWQRIGDALAELLDRPPAPQTGSDRHRHRKK